MTQLTIDFDAPHCGRATSRAAARAIKPDANAIRAEVWRLFELAADGLTLDEVERISGRKGDTIRPRVWELRKAGLVEDSGRTRPTRSGRAAIVWHVTREA